MASPRLGATELVESQATPETTVNAMNRHTEQFASRGIVKDKDLATPPGSPADGDAYIVAASATGDWTGWAGRVAYYSSGWKSITPIEGVRAYVQDENVDYEYNGSAWAAVATGAYTPGGTDVALADGGTGASLTDPNADRILFWDDSAGAMTWLTVGAGLAITGTSLAATGAGATIVVEDEGSVEGAAIDTLNFTGAGVSVTVVGSEAEVIIGGGSSRSPVNLGTMRPLTDFSQINISGNRSATDTSGKAISIVESSPDTTVRIVGLTRNLPSTTSRVAVFVQGNFQPRRFAGINFGFSDGTKFHTRCGVNSDATTATGNWEVQTWSNSTTRVSATALAHTPPAAYYSLGFWLGLRVDNASGKAYWEISSDGVYFSTLDVVTQSSGYLGAGGYTKAYVGLFAYNQDVGGTDYPCSVSILDWDEAGLSRTFA